MNNYIVKSYRFVIIVTGSVTTRTVKVHIKVINKYI